MVATPVDFLDRSAFFAAWSQMFSHRPALINQGTNQTMTYTTLWSEVQTLAAQLHAHGLRAGDHCGVYGLSREDTLLLFAACLMTGIVFVPIPSKYPVERIAFFTQQVPCKVVITAEKVESCSRWSDIRSHVVHEAGTIPRGDGAAMVIFTSGSSGTPKGVALSWGNLFYSAMGTNAFYDLSQEDTWLLNLPLFHVGGLMVAFRCWLVGATIELAMETSTEDVIGSSRANLFSLVPTQLQRALRHEAALQNLQKAKAILLGGAATSASLMESTQKQEVPVSVTYGASECCAQLTATQPGAAWKVGLVGEPLPYREVRLKQGRVAFRGATCFQGYWREGLLDKPFDGDGWFITEDEGAVRVDGQVIVLGRMDDIFQSGGENIAPREIEEVLHQLDLVGEWLVFPRPDKEYGAVPVAVFWGMQRPDLPNLSSFLQSHLPGLKRPKELYWLSAQEQMKPERGWLKASFAAGIVPMELQTLI